MDPILAKASSDAEKLRILDAYMLGVTQTEIAHVRNLHSDLMLRMFLNKIFDRLRHHLGLPGLTDVVKSRLRPENICKVIKHLGDLVEISTADDLESLATQTFLDYEITALETVVEHFRTATPILIDLHPEFRGGLTSSNPYAQVETTFTSFDLKSANYTAFNYLCGKYFGSWAEVLESVLDDHPVFKPFLIKSKHFRQIALALTFKALNIETLISKTLAYLVDSQIKAIGLKPSYVNGDEIFYKDTIPADVCVQPGFRRLTLRVDRVTPYGTIIIKDGVEIMVCYNTKAISTVIAGYLDSES